MRSIALEERDARQRRTLQSGRQTVWDMMRRFTTSTSSSSSANSADVTALRHDSSALEELSRQLFLESVDLQNEQVGVKFVVMCVHSGYIAA